MTKNNEDALFGEAGKVQFNYIKFETPGDKVKGVYVGNYTSISAKYGYEQVNYVLLKEDGEKVIVSGRNATKTNPVRIIFGMEKIPMGAVMGFIYTGDKDTGKGNPAKLIEPRYAGEKDINTYNKFKEMYNLNEIKDEATTNETTEAVNASDEF
jgi:hypothetical protein